MLIFERVMCPFFAQKGQGTEVFLALPCPFRAGPFLRKSFARKGLRLLQARLSLRLSLLLHKIGRFNVGECKAVQGDAN